MNLFYFRAEHFKDGEKSIRAFPNAKDFVAIARAIEAARR
jgi:hypothetical protein